MNWIEIASYKKEIPANKTLLISCKDESWIAATLVRIEFGANGKTHIFKSGENEIEDATHFMIVEPPKK